MDKETFLNKINTIGIKISKGTASMLTELKDGDNVDFEKLSKDTIESISNYFRKECLKDNPNPNLIVALMLYDSKT